MTDNIKDPRGIDEQNHQIARVERKDDPDAPKKNIPEDKDAFKKTLSAEDPREALSKKEAKKGGSLFELASGSRAGKSEGEAKTSETGTAGLPKSGKGKVDQLGVLKPEKKATQAVGKTEKELLEQAQAALAPAVVEGAKEAGPILTSAANSVATPDSVDMKAIAKSIADQIIVTTKGDIVDTQVTLKHPPLFEGATVKLTEVATAKGEYGVSFSNLSDPAKLLIDNPLNQAVLRETLDAKGIPLHIISSSAGDTSVADSGEARGEDREGRESAGGFEQDSSHHQGEEEEQGDFQA